MAPSCIKEPDCVSVPPTEYSSVTVTYDEYSLYDVEGNVTANTPWAANTPNATIKNFSLFIIYFCSFHVILSETKDLIMFARP